MSCATAAMAVMAPVGMACHAVLLRSRWLLCLSLVPGGGTPRSGALGWTELGTGPAKGPVVS